MSQQQRRRDDVEAGRVAAGSRVAARREAQLPAIPPGLSAITDLQRRIGNRAVCRLLEVGQPKLDVGSTWDPGEEEADLVARQVVASLRLAGRTDGTGGPPDRDETRTGTVRRQAVVGAAGGTLDSDTESEIQAARRGGAPLDAPTKVAMEGAFGADFSSVRVHTGPASSELNDRVQAKAFTVGSDIFFRGAAPDSRTSHGQELLAHELAHTIQQGHSKSRPDQDS
jgi:hypothetical protein